ncbi:5-dehydro-4-deoxy-D-glucuronate isomerase [Ornithobacterium rhinotracheale]|uniref:5-dehydro-4-deoxy-D-glucuronate isomerase n=1 Tax=Ornithobacterium rhinotracheale TaxID=28251 RepID=UPI00129C97F6|nr:5-dehydro-4-deoxy-D-glucuronate isomerase [Ornithobacterium rhinotracheale]MRJ07485.1 5-dehydro-4-deoxy-D-glucuronate isomerase [Ornithobacterium rhinotracheale]UOH78079.1 5-dehydro-4-deoxy-D-glucuronate isomerase [Ornithobacterium rhinotracheale]
MKKTLSLLSLLLISGLTLAQSYTSYEVRYATNPKDAEHYSTERLREEYLVKDLFKEDKVHMVYTLHDRFIIGGAMPVKQSLKLEAIDPLKSPKFLSHREIGIINVGGKGIVKVGNKKYELKNKEALYIGRSEDEVTFSSASAKEPALFYFNSANAHTSYPTKKITREDAVKVKAGSLEESNARTIVKYIVNQTTKTCQLQLGLTELEPGSVWNTMPAHIHARRMEAYFYFKVPEKQAVCHFMGEPEKTRNIWVHNLEAVIAPEWSIHAGAGTTNYDFIWGMAGENLDYTDMDKVYPYDLK